MFVFRWSAVIALLLVGCASSGSGPTSGAGGSDEAGSGGVVSGGSAGLAAAGSGNSAPTNGGAGIGGFSVGGSAAGWFNGAGGVSSGGSGTSGSAGSLGSSGAGGRGPGGPLKIMPVGDSITEGAHGTNAGYRGPLYGLLKQTSLDVLFVGSSVQGGVTVTIDALPKEQRHNEGHSSYTINDIDDNLDGLDTATFQMYGGADRNPNGGHWFDGVASGPQARPPLYPDVITLMIGTNNADDTDRGQVHDQLHALITKITNERPNARLIVAQITPSSRPNNVSYNMMGGQRGCCLSGSG
jgi:hypothetical protein